MTTDQLRPVGVTAVIKAKNEAAQIIDCVRSCRLLADEVIVVDDASTDDTAELAASAGARVIAAKSREGLINELDNIGFDAAVNDWVLRIDADERMTPTLAAELRRLGGQPDLAGVRFARRNYMFGDWARHGGWFRSEQLRFLRRSAITDPQWGLGGLHEQVPVSGRVVELPADPDLATLHYDYDDMATFAMRTFARYARGDALVMQRQGAQPAPVRTLVGVTRKFVGRYLIRQGFRDGQRGLVLAVLLSLYDVFVQLHLWDLRRDRSRESPAAAANFAARQGR